MEGRWSSATKRRRSASQRPRRGSQPHDISVVRRGRRTAFGGSVESKVRELQRLVPGGRELCADQLFSRTADYILELRMQVHALKVISKLYVP